MFCDIIKWELLYFWRQSYRNPPKTFSLHLNKLATVSVNPRKTSWANPSEEDNGSSSQDMRKGKRKHLTNFNKNKKVAREASESYPPAEDLVQLQCIGKNRSTNMKNLISIINVMFNPVSTGCLAINFCEMQGFQDWFYLIFAQIFGIFQCPNFCLCIH